MSRHRDQRVRPRYGRLAALASSLSVTAIAVFGGLGGLPSAADGGAADPAGPGADAVEAVSESGPAADAGAGSGAGAALRDAPATKPLVDPRVDATLPAGSGSGKRVVFSQSRQRVWLVPRGRHVARTYLVSGSVYDNLDPGTYAVYSRSEHAVGFDDSGTMRYFVRFTRGENAAIGFHDIPVDEDGPVQTRAELGTPLSHGCIRQHRSDAIALWDFAPIGTTVVVTP